VVQPTFVLDLLYLENVKQQHDRLVFRACHAKVDTGFAVKTGGKTKTQSVLVNPLICDTR
jgi:hypothetical protein